MKKIVALVLCLVMMVGLMSGCQKKMDADTLYQNMNEAMKAVTAQAADMEMDLEFTVSTMGISMNIAMSMDMAMQAKSDLSAMHMDITADMDAMGQSEEISMEVYTAVEDDAIVSYVHESDAETWVKSVEEGYRELTAQIQELTKELGLDQQTMPKGTLTLEKDQITVNDRKCYVLTQQVGGEELKTLLNTYMDKILNAAIEESGEEIDEETQQVLDVFKNLDWSKLSYKMVYHVDAETFLPVEGVTEITGLGETLNGMIDTIMAMAMMEMDEEAPAFSVEIPTLKMTLSNMRYNDAAEVPAVPQEVIDSAVDMDDLMMDDELIDTEVSNPAQPDGSYLLSMGGSSVSVTLPEGYMAFLSETDMLVGMSADMLNSLTFMLVEDVTAEDMKVGVLSEVDAAKEAEFYKSHSEVAEVNGYSTMSLIYNDETSLWYAWKELDGCVLLLGAEVEGETYDLAELFAAVQIAE